MTTVLLVRHGLTDANTGGTLAGWTPGVHLADKGREQVERVAQRLAPIPLAAIVSSPLERCQETAAAIVAGHGAPSAEVTGKASAGRGKPPGTAPRHLAVETDERLGECRYGDWQGKPLKTLAKDPLWKVVQAHPSAAVFPGGEALRDTQARAVAAVREHNARLGPDAVWIAVSHGDVIKAILADALGLHLDEFQRIVVDPASVSIVNYTPMRPFVVRMNDVGGDVASLIPPKSAKRRRGSDAAVGGGAGGGR